MLTWLLTKVNLLIHAKHYLSTAEYENYLDTHPEDTEFFAETGAEAIKQVLSHD